MSHWFNFLYFEFHKKKVDTYQISSFKSNQSKQIRDDRYSKTNIPVHEVY